MSLDKVARVNLLYDFYGALLTPKQQQAIEMHYHEDLSLGEMAAALGISRQAIHDLLVRTEGLLENYEAALGLVKKHVRQRMALQCLGEHLRSLAERCSGDARYSGDPETQNRLKTALAIVQGLLRE